MISFVYFDVGGVLIRDFSGTNKWEELKNELGIPDNLSTEFDSFWEEIEPELSLGKDTDSLIPIIEEKFGVTVPEEYSLFKNGFLDRFEVNTSIWPVAKKIKSKYRSGLLTNMYPGMLEGIKSRNLLPDITWDEVIDSSIVKLQKPDSAIFKLAENRAGLTGSQILFIDNSLKNIESAKSLGWLTFRYDPGNINKSTDELIEFVRLNLDIIYP